MKIIRICLMGLVMILSATLNADVRQYHFSHLTMDDGLSHNDITAIIQDAYGFMWFATRDGLNRYDGNKVKVYKSECSPNNSQGINSIFSLCLAPDSTLWMGAQGILCYDTQGDSLRQVQIKTVEGRSPKGMILSVKANTKGVLFFLEKDEGIYSYDPQTCRCQFYSFANLKVGVSKVTATAMWIDNDDNVWIGGDKECLIQLDYTTGNYHAVKIDCLNAENDGMQVITGNGHYIYMGFQYSGVVRYDLNDKTVQCLKIGESVEEPLYVHDIQISDNGLWLATETGLYLYDEIQKKASKCVNDYFDKRSLSDNAIYAVYRDSDNGLWVGTYFGGINYMSINENRYIESYYPIATKTSLKGRVVREIRSDSMGNLWIGTEDAGLNYFNSQEKSIIPVSAHLEHYNVHGLCVIDDELYVGVYSGGLNIYNLNTGAVKRYYISDERYNVQNSIYAIYQDTKGRIWICTQGGLYWFSPKEGTFTRINGFSNMYVHNICEDFIELHGDREGMDDRAIIGGLAKIDGKPVMIIGTMKGKSTKENLEYNFGMPQPQGYRKALRLFKHASKFNIPIVTLIDTPGAYPGISAEETNQGGAIAVNLMQMAKLKVPVIAIITGEGCSGGALGLAVADKVFLLEHAYYTVISPEGCASILWRDATKASEAADALKITAKDLMQFDIIDGEIKEPTGGAHTNYEEVSANMKKTILDSIEELSKLSVEDLKEQRYQKFRKMGVFLQ